MKRWGQDLGMLIAAIIVLAVPGCAQFIDVGDYAAPGVNTPVIADMNLRIISATPWGTFTQSLQGKFWRSKEGKRRQDFPYRTSYILVSHAQIWLDHEAKTAIVEDNPHPFP